MNNAIKRATLIFSLIGMLATVTPAAANPPDIWGAKFIVSHLSLNAAGFVSFLKVANPGASSSLSITGDIIFTRADGTEGEVKGVQLGVVDQKGVTTIGEATILEAIDNPTQLVDASMVLFIQNPKAIVIAERKASDGRVSIPVERVFLLTDPAAS